ncbi:MAG: chitobiase/beta-hexosaminidase C-terminal domain-containing protein, partial [Paludibacteraceae bacterium]
MKRFTLLLSAMLLACATSLWADVATLTFTAACSGSGTDDKGNAWTITSDAEESTYDATKGIHYGTAQKAVSYLTLTNSTIAGTITKIVVNASGASETSAKLDVTVGGAAFGSQQNLTATATEYTFEGSATGEILVKLSQTSAKKALYVKSIAVTYSTVAPAVPTPIFYAYDNVDDVENNGFYTSDLLVEIDCEDYETTIRYTTDGTEPTAESDVYDGETGLFFNNEFVTLRAKAFKGENTSNEAKANYYHNSSLTVPYTTSEAITLYNALGNVSNIYVNGVVTGFPSHNSPSSTYNITDGETTLCIYEGIADASSTLDDIANLVEGDTVVVKGDITKYGSTIELNSGNTIVKWTATTDPVLSCVKSIAFGNISSLVGSVPTKTLAVTAKNLTEDITVTLSDGAAFTLSTTTLPAAGGTIEITPVLTVGENTATLTLTSGEVSATVTLTATIKQAYTISWVVNGETYAAGEPTTNVTDGEKVSVLPTSPADNTLSCSNVFVGWSTNNVGSAAGQTQPKDLFISTGTAPAVTENTTYYAVFATTNGEATLCINETFTKTDGTGGNDGKWSGSIASSTLTADSTGWTFVSGGGANQCAKLGTGS